MLLALFKTNSERRKGMDKDQVELYHNLGLMPDWVYYQLNGKSANENYRDIVNKRNTAFRILKDGRAKVQSATVEDNDVVFCSDNKVFILDFGSISLYIYCCFCNCLTVVF